MKLFRKIGLILLTGVLFFYVGYSLIKGTYSTEDEVPANSAFDDINFYKCVVKAYNNENNTSLPYTVNLSDEQLKTITDLGCNNYNSSDEKKVVSSKGLEKLTSLIYLYLSYNKLTSLDVSQNPALEYLYVGNNQLTSLDVSQNSALTDLDVGSNQLTSLDVSQNSALTYLNVRKNQLTSMNVSKNVALTRLWVDSNQLTSLDVSQNSALTDLRVSKNQLTSLDVSQNSALISLNVHDNQLISLDVSQNSALEYLYAYNNQLTSLDVSNNSALKKLEIYSNQLTSLDISQNLALKELLVYCNQLTSLDVSGATSLNTLYAEGNKLTGLDVSKNVALEALYAYGNHLTKLDVSNNSALTDLRVYENQLTSLDVSQNPTLFILDVSENQLTSLDVSQNPALFNLDVSKNQLTSLDVSQNPKLKYLYAYGNQLTRLDVSQNPSLFNLDVSKNQLTRLDVSNNSALESLRVSSNQLTSLDVSQNLKLSSSDVKIYNNPYCEVLYLYKGNNIYVGNNVKIPGHLGWPNPSWSSTDSNVATVDSSGLVTTLESGSVQVKGAVSDKYATTSTVNVVKITSNRYEINEDDNYIFIGSDNDADIIKSNINISDVNVNVDIDLNNYKLYVKYEDEVLKEFNLIGYSSLIYDLSKDYIYIGTDELDLEKINVVNCTKVVSDNKLLIKFGDELVKEYKLISISSSFYDLNKDYIYVGGSKLNVSDITVSNNGSVLEKDNKVLIKYNNEVFREYELVSISSNVYDLSKDYIYIGTNDISNINVVNANLNVENDELLVKYNEDVLDEYKLLSIKFNNYQVFGKIITNVNDDNYEDFISNIVCSEDITYKLYDGEAEVTSGIVSSGMKLDIYYNGNKIYEYIISDYYLTFDENLNVDEENNYIKYLNLGMTVGELIDKLDVVGSNVRIVIYTSSTYNSSKLDNDSLATGDVLVVYLNDVKKDEYTLSVLGDANGDSDINSIDLVQIRKHIVGWINPNTNDIYEKTGVYYYGIDMNRDGIINSIDLVRMRKKIVGLE